MNFREFFEMSGALTEPATDINFQSDGSGYKFSFKADNENYSVTFYKTFSGVADKAYEVNFYGPKGVSLTGLGKGPTVYSNVIRAIKKFVDTVKPESLIFYGANDYQDLMYNTFYEKYMKNYFVRISDSEYLSREYVNQLSQAPPNTVAAQRYQMIQDDIKGAEVEMQGNIKAWRDLKNLRRQQKRGVV